jgi:hypothetical protein
MEKICWNKHVKNYETLHRVKEERNILQTTKHRKDNCIGKILCRNGLLRQFIEGNKRKDRRDGKTWKKSGHLLDDRKEARRYWKLQE